MGNRPLVHSYSDYKEFVIDTVENCEEYGRGTYQRIAEQLSVNTTYVSQIIRGNKHLSVDQAYHLCGFLGLNSDEVQYFMFLVQRDRCANFETKSYFDQQLKLLQRRSQELANFVLPHEEVDPRDQALFYSDPLFSSVRLLTGIPKYQYPEAIAERLGVDKEKVIEVLEFLVKTGLCRSEDGRYKIGPANTHLGRDSLSINQHHINWRLRSWSNLPTLADREMAFTAPLTIRRDDAQKIYDELCRAVESCSQIVDQSPPEDLYCLLIDFFQV